MKMALQGTVLMIREADTVQFSIIKSWGKMKWDRQSQTLKGTADLELLDKLAEMVRLPPAVEARRSSLREVADAVGQERMNPDPVPLVHYPVMRFNLRIAKPVAGWAFSLYTLSPISSKDLTSLRLFAFWNCA